MNAANVEKCDWCRGTGMITAYHRDYRGSSDVIEEHTDRRGEVRSRKVPGTIAVHCNCQLGGWMHESTDPEIRHRIPTMAQVLQGCGRYSFERCDADDQDEICDSARAFLRGWKAKLRNGQPLPRVVRPDPVDAADALRGRTERIRREGGAA